MKLKSLLLIIIGFTLFTNCGNPPERKESIANPNECTQYACPMHPDHTSTAPGKCPECGMELEKTLNKSSDSIPPAKDEKK